MEPEFDNIDKYLQSGERTKVTDKIKDVSKQIDGQTDIMLIGNILMWMNQNTVRLKNGKDTRKFKRAADEILESGERTGCCDSSTLFTALARSKNIPTMQIITWNKEWGKSIDRGEKTGTRGHYFVACYVSDKMGKYDWFLIDSDRDIKDIRDIRFSRLNKEDRNIDENYYAFAYVRDYSDVICNGIRIDSIKNMADIQITAYRQGREKDCLDEER